MTRRQYGSGSIYQRASDGRWIGTIEAGYHKNGARRRITVSSPGCLPECAPSCKHRTAIKTKLKLRQRDLDRGDDQSSRSTVKTWADTWLAMTARTVRPNTHTSDRSAVGWIVQTIGHRRIDQLTPGDIRSLAAAIDAKGLSTSTAHRYHATLQRMLKAANEEGLPVPPRVLTVTGPAPAVNDRTDIRLPDALAILSVASTLPHGARWVAAFLQGMRQGEALGLTWDDVRDDSYVVSWQLQPLPYKIPRDRTSGFRIPDGYEARQLQGQLHLVRPKTKAGWRVVPLLPVVADGLAVWRQIAPDNPHGLVWPAINGNPANEDADRREFYALQCTAEVGHPAGRYYKLHEARHTTATLLLEMGVPESVRIAIMGHSAVASTRAYEHIDIREMRTALEKVASRLQIG